MCGYAGVCVGMWMYGGGGGGGGVSMVVCGGVLANTQVTTQLYVCS